LQPCGGHLAGAEQQMRVDLMECLPGVRIEQRDSCGEKAFLIPSGGVRGRERRLADQRNGATAPPRTRGEGCPCCVPSVDTCLL
jgi:hypothetical protein